jgi:oxaloacetate decarboxylase beta subunit
LGIVRKFEPLLLVTIGFGGLLSNIPGAGIAEEGGLLFLAYEVGIKSGAFPLIIFMGVGALTDFGPLLANPRTLFLGAAAQFGIFATLLGALGMTQLGWMDSDSDICRRTTRAELAGRDCRGRLFLHGARADDPAADHEAADD